MAGATGMAPTRAASSASGALPQAGAPGHDALFATPGAPAPASSALPSVPAADDPADARAVEAAATLFLARGIASVRMTDVAEAAGVGVATLYRHFGGKQRLVAAAGTLLWRRLDAHIEGIVESDAFLSLDGLGRLARLLGEYGEVFAAHRDFVRFLAEFDHLMAGDASAREALADYGDAVDSFYLIFEDAYLLGRQDGSIVRELDFPVLYRSVTHALMGLAEKLVQGEVIPSDDFSGAAGELGCMVDVVCWALASGDAGAGAQG